MDSNENGNGIVLPGTDSVPVFSQRGRRALVRRHGQSDHILFNTSKNVVITGHIPDLTKTFFDLEVPRIDHSRVDIKHLTRDGYGVQVYHECAASNSFVVHQ